MLTYITVKKTQVNFQKYESEFERQFPKSYDKFRKHESYNNDFNEACILFLKFFQIEIDCYQASAGSKYQNTYTAKIKINSTEKLKLLGRTSNTFNYPHKSTLESAVHKALSKGFEIVEALLSKKLLPERKRRSKLR